LLTSNPSIVATDRAGQSGRWPTMKRIRGPGAKASTCSNPSAESRVLCRLHSGTMRLPARLRSSLGAKALLFECGWARPGGSKCIRQLLHHPTGAQENGDRPSSWACGVSATWSGTYVSRSVDLFTRHLGFKLDQRNPPAFAQVSINHLKLIVSGPGSSGSRPMPNGDRQ
jgi:hypothetical protein